VTPGNLEFVQVVVSMTMVPATVAAIVRLDQQRLSADRLARGWPPLTRDAVVFASWQFGILFGCPALIVWFVKTRGWLIGSGLGLLAAGWLLAVAVASELVPEATIEWLGL
jgi:hypothetical protein